ncbi:MAG: hypothetical protein PHR83_11795 [Paludibacter sp.]|nr:hypothetical protein [Paludibacter sp.]
MISRKFRLIISLLTVTIMATATHKVYIIHGYGGFGLQMEKIHNAIQKSGYESENFTYQSFTKDIDSVAITLFEKIRNENIDTVSFVTHSMGALVVRALYRHLDKNIHFPQIYRFIMLAPPNKGTPVADFYKNYGFILPIGGPNVEHMTTDSASYANQLPIPTCEVGLILAITGKKPWYNPFMKDDNDGLISANYAKLGIEKDIVVIKSQHAAMTQNKKVIKLILEFLKTGSFQE